MTVNRILLVRHGETEGESSIRYHGSADVALSDEGRAHMREARRGLPGGDLYDFVVSSPMQRAWESAEILAPGLPIQLEADFREIDFGRWEGLTAEEIEARDPVLFADWRDGSEGFEYPGGERRADFRARVQRGLERLLGGPSRGAIVVAHKGVLRTIAELLTGESPEGDGLVLGGMVQVTRRADGAWYIGRNSSNPPALEALA